MPTCDACNQPMKRIKIGNAIYWVCITPDCHYWEGTPDLPPHPCDDIQSYKEKK